MIKVSFLDGIMPAEIYGHTIGDAFARSLSHLARRVPYTPGAGYMEPINLGAIAYLGGEDVSNSRRGDRNFFRALIELADTRIVAIDYVAEEVRHA